MGDGLWWTFSVIYGALGLGYFTYGKRQGRFVALGSGIALCILPYLFKTGGWLAIGGAPLVALPFFVRY